ncbi:MAG: hypothetical protein ACRYGP_28480 [Janthinobacterium lividum]
MADGVGACDASALPNRLRSCSSGRGRTSGFLCRQAYAERDDEIRRSMLRKRLALHFKVNAFRQQSRESFPQIG